MISPSTTAEPRRHPLCVDDLVRMVAAGIVAEDARVELIEGELIDMTPINAPHSGTLNRLNRLFVQAVGELGVVSVQNSVRLNDLNLPQPDLTLLRARSDDYVVRLPTVPDILLVLEVSDSTLTYDRNRKAPIYAASGVPEVWIVDVNGQKVIRFREPSPEGYRKIDEPRGTIAPALLPACSIEVANMFPS